MKITVDKSIPDLTEEEIDELKGADIKDAAEDPELFKKHMLEAKEFIFSPQVLKQLEEMGMTPDDIVAMMLDRAGAKQ